MLELTKTHRTDGLVEVRAVVTAKQAEAVAKAIKEAVEPNIPAEEVFPESYPGSVLRGARGLREMTQAALATEIGVHKSHISEMERGKRPIGKEMAKRLGRALNFPYKAFL
jgi:ribosome-binding protein aMBF1 (putative translation factor)